MPLPKQLLLALQQQLLGQWHQWKEGTIDWQTLRRCCWPIRQSFEATLQRVVELGYQRGEQTPWAKTVRTCQLLLKMADGLWTFLEIEGVEPTNNSTVDAVFSAGVRDLRQSVIQRKIRDLPSNSHGVQSRQGAICRSRLLTWLPDTSHSETVMRQPAVGPGVAVAVAQSA